MMKRRPSSAVAVALLGVVFAGTTIPASDKDAPPRQVSIEAQFVEYLPDGRLNPLATPKLTVLVGKPAAIRCGEERAFPAGLSFEEGGDLPAERRDTVLEGILLEVTARLLNGAVLLDGRGTITDILDTVQTNPPNEGEAVSYALRSVVTPLSLLLIPGEDYVTVPTAKRDRRTEIRLRVTLPKPAPADLRGTIAAKCLKDDLYLIEILIKKDLPGGQTAIVSAPQIVVTGEAEGKIV